jgi:hypothetical protein
MLSITLCYRQQAVLRGGCARRWRVGGVTAALPTFDYFDTIFRTEHELARASEEPGDADNAACSPL